MLFLFQPKKTRQKGQKINASLWHRRRADKLSAAAAAAAARRPKKIGGGAKKMSAAAARRGRRTTLLGASRLDAKSPRLLNKCILVIFE